MAPLYDARLVAYYGRRDRVRKRMIWKVVFRSKGRGRSMRPKWVRR